MRLSCCCGDLEEEKDYTSKSFYSMVGKRKRPLFTQKRFVLKSAGSIHQNQAMRPSKVQFEPRPEQLEAIRTTMSTQKGHGALAVQCLPFNQSFSCLLFVLNKTDLSITYVHGRNLHCVQQKVCRAAATKQGAPKR